MIYGLKHYRKQPAFIKIDATRGAMSETELAVPSVVRAFPALANHNNRFIFSSGGYVLGKYEFL